MLIGSEDISGTRTVDSKAVRVNGIPRRAGDVVGQVKAVLFAPADVDLVTGSPSSTSIHRLTAVPGRLLISLACCSLTARSCSNEMRC